MTLVFGPSVDIRDGQNDSPTGAFGVFRLGSDLVLSTWPSADARGASFSVVTLAGAEVIAAQALDPSRHVAGSRAVEEQEIFGALLSADGRTLTVFFSEQGFDQAAFDYTGQNYIRKYDIATGQPLGASTPADTPAFLTPNNSFSIQTGSGHLAVSAGYSGLGGLSNPRDLGLIRFDDQGQVLSGPQLAPPASYSSPNAGGQVVLETGAGLMTIHASLTLGGSFWAPTFGSKITGQRHTPDGQPVGDRFTIFENVTHPVNTGPQTAVRAAVLTDGRVVVVTPDANARVPAGQGDDANLTAVILNMDGSVAVPAFGIRQAPDQRSGSASPFFSVNALENGGFIVGYNIQGSSQRENYAFQIYDADAQPAGHATYTATPADALSGAALTQENTILRADGTGLIISAGASNARLFTVPVPEAPPPAAPVVETGTDGPDLLVGDAGNDRLDGAGGNDTLRGQDGADTLLGGTGDDLIFGGATSGDLRDIINGGDGNDTVNAGAGNDEVSGGNGDDLILGDAGSDTLIGNAGNDTLSGGGLSDVIFGGPGDDFLNGGFGFDRLNGGAGADTFYHLGIRDHGSDWIQDYDAAAGDVLVTGLVGADPSQFQVNIATTPNAGADGVQEAFVIYRPTGQILWALVDGAAQDRIMVSGPSFAAIDILA
jgi:Ca2+-binding RTX toxin-like protein